MAKSLEGKSIIVTGAGPRHRARDRAALRRRRRQGRGQRSRRRRRRLGHERLRRPRKWSRRSRSAAARRSPISRRVAEAIPASKIVKTAIDSFGKLDGVVNNAGILRDAIFHRMSIDAFESVIKVHLMGSFYVSHAAARLFREQESGSFVHFTSTSGLVGNFGQANYAAAKLGIVGLSKSIALDMGRFNVRSNCVSPFAWSRLIGTIPTETEAEKARVAKIQQMGPEKIAPVVRLPAQRRRQGRHRADLRGAHERDLPDEPVAPAALGPPRRRLDAADHRRARHAGAEIVVLQARPLGGCFQLGCDLSRIRRYVVQTMRGNDSVVSSKASPALCRIAGIVSSQQKTWEEIMTNPLTFSLTKTMAERQASIAAPC